MECQFRIFEAMSKSWFVRFPLVTCLFVSGQLLAQEKFSDNLKVQANYHYGFVLPEYTFVSHVVDRPVQSLDVSFMKERTGRDAYERLYNYPEQGVAFFFTSLGNKDVFGHAFALNYFFRINMVDRKRFKMYNRMGIGLGYLTKVHHLYDDPTAMNVAIGSHVNIHFNCRFGARYQFSNKMNANLGVSFDHYSNANTSEPNIGINLLTGYVGMSYLLGKALERDESELPEYQRKWSFETFMSVGGKHTRAFSNRYYFTASTSTQAVYELFRGFHLGAGADIFFDGSTKSQLTDAELSYSPEQSFQTGVHISQIIAYRNFRFALQEGFYIGLGDPVNHKRMYNRGVLQYYINKQWSVRLAMKSHLHILDYPELGVGFKWK